MGMMKLINNNYDLGFSAGRIPRLITDLLCVGNSDISLKE